MGPRQNQMKVYDVLRNVFTLETKINSNSMTLNLNNDARENRLPNETNKFVHNHKYYNSVPVTVLRIMRTKNIQTLMYYVLSTGVYIS